MKLALENSNTYDSIKTRLGDGLVAQGRVSQYQSQDLGENYWRVEAERLFQTSLARIQYDAWAIGTGEDQPRVRDDGYSNDTPDEAGNLCGILKFLSTEYRNVPATLYIWLMFIYPGLLLLSMKVKTVVRVGHWIKEHCYLECCTKRRGKGKNAKSLPPGANGTANATIIGAPDPAQDTESVLPGPDTDVDATRSTIPDPTQDLPPGPVMQSNPPNTTRSATREGTENSEPNPWEDSAGDDTGDDEENASGGGITSTAANNTATNGHENEGDLQDAGEMESETRAETTLSYADIDEEELAHWILVELLGRLLYWIIVGPFLVGFATTYEAIRGWFEGRQVVPPTGGVSATALNGEQIV